MDRKTVEKFFASRTTQEETEQVLAWFETSEGRRYLQERLDVDFGLMDREELRARVPELDSEKLYHSIQKDIGVKNYIFSFRRTDWLGYAVKTAALFLVVLTASLFSTFHQQCVADQLADLEPVIFQTGGEQHREITLGDGSVVRMNEHSELIVSKDFLQGIREITLNGEAYFDVAHNPDQPFIIHANSSTVEVLGTAFNIRSVPGQDNVQVAVVEGRVSFKNVSEVNPGLNSVTLSRGQFGYMDITEGSIVVDDHAVENYLSWKTGRLIFENQSLGQVCLQLSRLYEISCSFAAEEIRDLQLTANFSDDSLDKALEVIALTLKLGYAKDGHHVNWVHETDSGKSFND